MSITSMLSQLSPPRLVDGFQFPTYRQICLPSTESILETGQPILRQLSELLEGYSTSVDQTINTLFALNKGQDEDRSARRVLFFGEQHHQPFVLKAQLQILGRLATLAKQREVNLHVVFEHFNLLDQTALDKITSTSGPEGLTIPPIKSNDDGSNTKLLTSEGFHLAHYWPIVQLAKENGAHVWAGFPPRDWARRIASAKATTKQSKEEREEKVKNDNDYQNHIFDQIKLLDQSREKKNDPSFCFVPPLSEERWKLVSNVSWSHRSYLKNLFNPQNPPQIQEEEGVIEPPEESYGFLPAQTLKDTYLAHVIDQALSFGSQSNGISNENLVIVFCGAGHCEWGFGAPERLNAMRKRQESVIVVSKPEDAGVWYRDQGQRASREKEEGERSSYDVGSWDRKLADVILPYEWVENNQ